MGEQFTPRVKAVSTFKDRSKAFVPGYPSLCCFLPAGPSWSFPTGHTVSVVTCHLGQYGLWTLMVSKPSWHFSPPFPFCSPHMYCCVVQCFPEVNDENWLYFCLPGTLSEAPSWPSWLSNHIPVYSLIRFTVLQKTYQVGHTIIYVCVCLLCQSIMSSKVLIPILVAQTVKNLPAMQEMHVPSLGREDPRKREWQLTPVFLPGESHGQRSLAGFSP